jgi:LacI family transcriptional regulator/LacI family repressor for deo operon, udp, cdd, tsx, nupC, and nupG
MKKNLVTIIDIARQLNVSKSTVSRALTGHPRVHPETRDKILQLAEEWEYQRNMLSISLITKRTNTIGIIVPEIQSSFFPKVIMGAQEIAEKAGYNLVISNSNECYETEVANAKVMLANQVDGLLISITKQTLNFNHLTIFQRKSIPVVFFNRVCDEMDAPKVIVDDFDSAFKITEYLIKKGRKRIAHLGGPVNLKISEKRMNGYIACLSKYQLPVDRELIINYDLNLEKLPIYVNHLLNLENPPDAIFAVNDPTAIDAIRIIKKRGLRIPNDIAVVGFSDDYAASLVDPPLTTVSLPLTEMGKTASQLLIDQINREGQQKIIIKMLKGELVIRESA